MTRVLTLWKHGIKTGLLSGLITVLLSLMGMVEAFSQRQIVSGVLSMDRCASGCGGGVYGLSCRENEPPGLIPCGS